MPVNHKSNKGNATFALAIVKASFISDHAEASRVRAALQRIFPGICLILVAEDSELGSYQGQHELAHFAKETPFRVISSSRITSN